MFSALGLPAGATAVAIVVSPGFVVIAADSRAVDASGKAQPDVCKIHKVGETIYVANKFVDDSAVDYSLDRTVRAARGGSAIDLAENVKRLIIKPLTAALEHQRGNNIAAYLTNFASGQAMGVTFIAFENKTPSVVDLRFFIEDLNAHKLSVRAEEHRCPGPDCPGGYAMLLTPNDLAPQFEAAHPRYWIGEAAAVAASAEAFVNLALDEKRIDIGPPLSLFVLDSPKGRWLKSGLCGE
jgi:hypothetical protein